MVEESRARPPNSTKVFVGNISATCSADDLHGLFSTFGRVLDCDKVKGGFRTWNCDTTNESLLVSELEFGAKNTDELSQQSR